MKKQHPPTNEPLLDPKYVTHINRQVDSSETFERHFDDLFDDIKSYGRYQCLCFMLFIFTTISYAGNTANGFMSLGGYKPTYSCSDDGLNLTTKQADESCMLIRNCTNLTIITEYYSLYQEFEWACLPPYLIPTIASSLVVTAVIGYLSSGHLADHFGRKKVLIGGFTLYYICSIAAALVPDWRIYMVFVALKGIFATTFTGPAYTLLQETVGKKHRLTQSFAFHWTFGYIVGFITWQWRHWRHTLLICNLVCLPSVFLFFLLAESPRWLLQKGRFERAASALNWIACINGVPYRFTAEELTHVNVGQNVRKRAYNSLHLLSNRRLIMYSISQILTGTMVNIIMSVILMGIQDLAGSPFLNIAMFGILRLWTPFFAVAFEQKFRWFGRRLLLLGALGVISICFVTMTLIYALGYWTQLHWLATAVGLFGYAVNVGLLWNAYKQLSTELFPTVIRAIAIGTFSFITLIGGVIGPQLIYFKVYWFAMPYAGTAFFSILAFVVAFFVIPETKGKVLFDTIEDMDEKKEVVTD